MTADRTSRGTVRPNYKSSPAKSTVAATSSATPAAGASAQQPGTLAEAIMAFNAATGSTLNPNSPWTTPNWDGSKTGGSSTGVANEFNAWQEKTYGSVGEYAPGSGKLTGSIPSSQQQFNYSANAPAGTKVSGTAPAAGTTQAASALQPTYLSQLFPKGLPQTATAQVGNVPQVNVAPVDPTKLTAQIMSSLEPQFAQQQRGLTESLANAGIVGGSTAGAVGALDNQQQTQALGQIAPQILAAEQGNQTTALQQGQANQTTAQQGGQYNATAQNANNQFNTSNSINAAMYDSTAGQTAQQQLANLQNQDYLAQLGLQGNLISAGANSTSGAYQPIYQQNSPVNYSGLTSALGSIPTPGSGNNTPAPAGTANYPYGSTPTTVA